MPEQQQTTPESGGQQQTGQGQQQGGGGTPTFDDWLGGQSADIRTLIEGHTAGLRSALQSEREQRRQFERELREAASQLEQGSAARTRLEEINQNLDTAERRAAFYESAHASGVTNLALAWLAVQQDPEMSDRRGNVDMARLREKFPELFGRQAAPAGNAGSGTQTAPASGASMNNFIRAAAGRPING